EGQKERFIESLLEIQDQGYLENTSEKLAFIWDIVFSTMVVVTSSAVTVIEDFSKDTLGRDKI
ncbi:WD repeat-containing protein 47 isoform X1, partial [Vespula maculifrons]